MNKVILAYHRIVVCTMATASQQITSEGSIATVQQLLDTLATSANVTLMSVTEVLIITFLTTFIVFFMPDFQIFCIWKERANFGSKRCDVLQNLEKSGWSFAYFNVDSKPLCN